MYNLYEKPKNPFNYVAVKISLASPDKIRVGHMAKLKSRRRSTTVRSSRSGRPVLCQDLRSGEGLRVLVRKVQAHEVSAASPARSVALRSSESKVRRERMGHIDLATPVATHLVPQEPAVSHRQPSRHLSEGPGEGSLLRVLHGHRPGESTARREQSFPRKTTRRWSRPSAMVLSRSAWAARSFA